jgi:hypothetical protein
MIFIASIPIGFKIANQKNQGGAPYIKGLSQVGGQGLRASSLNKELSKGTTFSLIYLAG